MKSLSREELEILVGNHIKKTPVTFNINDVPANLTNLIPYAEIWGISDDYERENLIEETPVIIKQNIKSIISQLEDELDEWLAGPEASLEKPSDAYIAFSALRMASDYI